MTNEQILEKAIEKAMSQAKDFDLQRLKLHFIQLGVDGLTGNILIGFQLNYDWNKFIKSLNYYRIIFSHDFAKAFWGKEIIDLGIGKPVGMAWQCHLQQIVLEPEPLKYLEKFL